MPFILIAAALLFAGTARAQADHRLAALEWLLGEWQRTTAKGTMYEHWERSGKDLWLGKVYRVQGQDTTMIESLRLEHMGPYVVFVSMVGNQVPVLFTLVRQEAGAWVFENTEHDFPQRVVYSTPKPGHLHAWIEGSVYGEAQQRDFHYTRKP
ncbi:MAG: DUF6265 family protein [Bacteroidota bacterium]